MEINTEIIKQITDAITQYNEIAIISHRNPDADTLGSTLALYEYLNTSDKHITPIVSGNISPVFSFLPHIHTFRQEFNPLDYDLIIACDCAAAHMTDFTEKYPELFKKTQPLINIDHHHGSNDNFGTINLVINAPSTTCIIYEYFKRINETITQTMATNLLTGLYTDTGSFMHGNTTPYSFRIASDLLMKGGDLNIITKNLFRTKSLNKLKLWGKIMENIYLDEDEQIALATISHEDLQEFNATHNDLSGVIDYINSIPDTKFSIILTEKGDNVKGSLRTQHNIDVSKIAAKFGGGGHKKAAGFIIPGKLQKRTIYEIVD